MKRVISAILLLAMTFSLNISVSAATSNSDNDFCIDDYEQYKIEFTDDQVNILADTDTKNNSIDEAIEYVKSLNLDSLGYSYIEEACLNELAAYKENEVELDSYTVLVPKARAKKYFGTYSNKDFYYDYTSVANMRRNTKGVEKGPSNEVQWDHWILGAMDLAMCFAKAKWSVPYSLIRTITGVSATSEVYYGSYNQYVEQFTNTKTRTIYRENGSQYKACYQDQTSSLRVKLYFCPVGDAFDSDYIEIDTIFNGMVSANDMTKNEILKSANTYANHNGMAVFQVSYHHVTEDWNN